MEWGSFAGMVHYFDGAWLGERELHFKVTKNSKN
jgi:hypothetical protein